MLHNQTTPLAVIINTDIYTKYDTVTIASSVPNNSNKSVIYPTMFDRWRDF
jgi:hypothetical protein